MASALDNYIAHLRENGSAPRLSDEQLAEIAEQAPYFPLPFATEAAAETNPARRSRLMERVALAASDQNMLFRLLSPDGRKFADFYPTENRTETPDTDTAINTFLSTYGKMDPREEALLERLIFNPVPDYSAVLEKEERQNTPQKTPEPQTKTDITDKSSDPENRTSSPAPKSELLTESLAKIYIKKGRFDKAHEIISQLNLNFPEKSIYFADQLRFLELLIKNQQLLEAENKKTES